MGFAGNGELSYRRDLTIKCITMRFCMISAVRQVNNSYLSHLDRKRTSHRMDGILFRTAACSD